MSVIYIQKTLSNYIEKLCYEEKSYQRFLNLVDKSLMSEQEWLESFNYFSILYEEAKIQKQFALEEIYNLYKDEIKDNQWNINFTNSAIIIGDDNICCNTCNDTFVESYNDFIRRLYPNEELEPIHINDDNVKNVTLQVTESCNMACSYCYQHHKTNNRMSFNTAKKIIDMLLDADYKTNTYITSTKAKGIVLEFIGGEPWLEIDLIAEISQYFINELFKRKHPWAIKFKFCICSNGLLHFHPAVQEYLKRYREILSYNISIDGNKELHDTCRIDLQGNGTYERAIQGVKNYRLSGGYMGSKMTIAPNNVDKVFEALKTMILNNYTEIYLNCVYEDGWTKNHANILYWQLHNITDWLFEHGLQDKINLSIFSEQCGQPLTENHLTNWCGGTGSMIAFDYQGNAYPCLRYMKTSSSDKYDLFIIGDLENGINQLEEHQSRIECLSCITRRSQSTDECFYCPIAMGCGWCSAYNYEEFGTPNKRATYICDMHKARSLANFYYQKKKGKDFQLHCPKEWAIPIIGPEEFDNLQQM